MRFVNGWNYIYKDRDRFNIEVRLGVLTLFHLLIDLSGHQYQLTLLNFRLEFGQ